MKNPVEPKLVRGRQDMVHGLVVNRRARGGGPEEGHTGRSGRSLSDRDAPRSPREITGGFLVISGLVLALAVGGCARYVPIRMDQPADTTFRLVWPQPPDAPRIQFLREFSTPRDLGSRRSLLGRVMSIFVGRGTERRIHQPYGIAVDEEERIFVADGGAHGVHLFDPARGRYEFFGGTNRRTFGTPIGVALAQDGRFFVSDSEAGLVVGMDDDGREFLLIEDDLLRPAGVAYDAAADRLYVVDVMGHQVVVFDGSGARVAAFGGRGAASGTFNFPTNVTVTADGTVHVTDAMNFRVQSFRPDGTFLSSFGEAGNRPGQFTRPKGVAVDSEGHIYVVEGLYDAVNIFDREGRLLLTFGTAGVGRGQFWLATGMFIDARDRIYVADSYNGRVQVFQYLAEGS